MDTSALTIYYSAQSSIEIIYNSENPFCLLYLIICEL